MRIKISSISFKLDSNLRLTIKIVLWNHMPIYFHHPRKQNTSVTKTKRQLQLVYIIKVLVTMTLKIYQ